ncbi:hypothetical protein [Streptomyces sp. NRRL S-146]|uniref:hypothetical protein n=1 Tax=Streptomyces sp. NRRL S-146 TaxID=1463884 RepID=UPI00131B8E49|nr:hypothetical protein [Streptomyces sp. NRRL S-146]
MAGAVPDHRPYRAATGDCWGSGARRRTDAERAQDQREWAQALATGGWSQVLAALRARVQRDRQRPPSLPDPPPRLAAPIERATPQAEADADQQLPLFDPPKQ